MSQSRFSIVLVGVSALLRRPLVSRLRPADGERSSWVVFAARVGRFESGFRSVVGLRVHRFRFSARAASELPLGELAFGLTASAFRPAPLRSCPRRVGLRAHFFRFSARTASEWPLGEFVLPPSVSEIALGGLAFGLTASAFRHAPIRSGRWAVGLRAYCFGDCHLAGWPLGSPLRKFRSAGWPSGSLLPLFGTHRFGVAAGRVRSSAFRFGDCHLAGWSSGSLLPLFGTHRFGVALGGLAFGLTASAFRHAPLRSCPRRVGLRAHGFRFSARTASGLPLGGLAFGLTASAFRHVPLRGCRWAGWPSGSRLPLFGTYRFGDCRWAGWPSGSRLSLFGTHRSAPPYRRREGRRSTPTRHLFHFKTLISTC